MSARMRWEHRIIQSRKDWGGDVIADMERDGWELTSVIIYPVGFFSTMAANWRETQLTLYFKRPRP